MSFFKKFNPIGRLIKTVEGRGNPQGYTDLGNAAAHNQDLDQAMKDYGNIETNVRNSYTDAAKKAGTYANTNEFNSGLNSEIQGGVRGARVEAVSRINALRKAAGNNEEFKPDGYDQTQGNNTANKLAENPVKEDSAAPQAAPEPTAQAAAPQANNAVASVQSPSSFSFNGAGRKQATLGPSAGFGARLGALQRRQ